MLYSKDPAGKNQASNCLEKQMRQMAECLPVIYFLPFGKVEGPPLYVFLSKLLRTLINNDNDKIENM